MTEKKQNWRDKPILKDHELQVLREMKKYRGQTRSHFQDSKEYYKKLRQAQDSLRKLHKELGTFHRMEIWLKDHLVEMSDDTIKKRYLEGMLFRDIEKKLANSLSHKGISREQFNALRTVLITVTIGRNPTFKKRLEEILKLKIIEKEGEDTTPKAIVTEEEEKLKQLTESPTKGRPKSALEPFKKGHIKKDKDKELSEEGERIKKLLKKYQRK